MLQSDAVRNLHFDSEIRVAQQPPLSQPIVFNGPANIISQPPVPARPTSFAISTVEQISKIGSPKLPLSGYSFLLDLPSIHIEQTFELNDTLTSISPENRFVVRSPLDDAIYAATESSSEKNRLLWGSARPFQMHVIDKTYQEALLFHKKLSLGFMCCQPQCLEVWIPPGDILGRIVQSPTLTVPEFYIEDAANNSPILCIEGPSKWGVFCHCLPKETYFKIHSGGDLRASIDRKWSTGKSQYTTNIYFSDSKLNAKERALILGAAFLLNWPLNEEIQRYYSSIRSQVYLNKPTSISELKEEIQRYIKEIQPHFCKMVLEKYGHEE